MPSLTKTTWTLLLLFQTIGCGAGAEKSTNNSDDASIDNDGDGHTTPSDCDDNNPNINPQADERCDGIDNDCDEIID